MHAHLLAVAVYHPAAREQTTRDMNLDDTWAPVLALSLTQQLAVYQRALRAPAPASDAPLRPNDEALRVRCRVPITADNVERTGRALGSSLERARAAWCLQRDADPRACALSTQTRTTRWWHNLLRQRQHR